MEHTIQNLKSLIMFSNITTKILLIISNEILYFFPKIKIIYQIRNCIHSILYTYFIFILQVGNLVIYSSCLKFEKIGYKLNFVYKHNNLKS